VETAVRDNKLYECSAGGFDALTEERGAFVTLKEHGELRGCIGYASPMKPLFETVRDVAALAAVRDRRFPPVTAMELGELEYEISVLSPLRRVLDVKQIRIGRDGLVLKRGRPKDCSCHKCPSKKAGTERPTWNSCAGKQDYRRARGRTRRPTCSPSRLWCSASIRRSHPRWSRV